MRPFHGKGTPDQVREEARRLIAELTERELEPITNSALCVDDLGADSLTAIRIMVALDRRYRVDMSMDEFNKIRVVNDAVHVVMRHLSDRAAAR